MFWSVSFVSYGDWVEELFSTEFDMMVWCELTHLLDSKRKVEFRRKVGNTWELYKPEWL